MSWICLILMAVVQARKKDFQIGEGGESSLLPTPASCWEQRNSFCILTMLTILLASMSAKCGDAWGHHCVTAHRWEGQACPDTPDSLDSSEAGSDWSILITLVSSEQSLSLLFEKDSFKGVSHGTYLSAESLWRTWAASYISKQGMQCYFFSSMC